MSRSQPPGGPIRLGFDDWERLVAQLARGPADGYPPYNIEHPGGQRLRVTVAVAGFAAEDLSVAVEDRCLVIRGRKAEEAGKRIFLHRGLAARPFQRIFPLAEGVEVGAAVLRHGLLQIDLWQIARPSQPRTIPISRGTPGPKGVAGA
jgi:HSP20 family molecular chaperone IbpA